jgi:histidyl-tRNA synthetase
VGAERILLALEAEGIEPGASDELLIYVAAAAHGQREAAFELTRELRGRGFKVISDLQDRSLKSQFRQADKAGADFVLTIGEEEQARGGVTLRNMKTKDERFVTPGSIVKMLVKQD